VREQAGDSPYDPIASLYDRWNTSVVEDIGFYVEEALRSGGPVLELGVGTGRIAVPIAQAGIEVIGVDSSAAMLERCRARARATGVDALLDLRLGDLRNPPVSGKVPLAISPFRAFLHLLSNEERLLTLERIRELLQPGGRLVFDVFAPTSDDIAETHGRWIEREPGIEERADWNWSERTLVLRVRGDEGETQMQLAWISVGEWQELLERAGFVLEACYGWFDRHPHAGDEDMVFVAQRK
jgi:SAM-dependent methyltransferase